MVSLQLADDFVEFLQLLNAKRVRYLLLGGYAVSYHGNPRATGDMDVWVAADPPNAERVTEALREFGFAVPELTPALFREPATVIRLGEPPLRIELLTSASGVDFEECYAERIVERMSGVSIPLIGLRHLRQNKRASGRHKDLADLENLPEEPA